MLRSVKFVVKLEFSVGAFYHHFVNKEGLIIAGYSEYDRSFNETVVVNIKIEDKAT